jgi:hypothetical protein
MRKYKRTTQKRRVEQKEKERRREKNKNQWKEGEKKDKYI